MITLATLAAALKSVPRCDGLAISVPGVNLATFEAKRLRAALDAMRGKTLGAVSVRFIPHKRRLEFSWRDGKGRLTLPDAEGVRRVVMVRRRPVERIFPFARLATLTLASETSKRHAAPPCHVEAGGSCGHAVCGAWSYLATLDQTLVTCKRCLAALQTSNEVPEDRKSA